jgi:ELWxxDGT repeat protein
LVVGDVLYFAGTGGAIGSQLWRSDGTAAGTFALTSVSSLGGIYPRQLTDLNGTLVFTADVNSDNQLWRSDGTAAGTMAVATVYHSNLNEIAELTTVNGELFFHVHESEGTRLWKSDGTASGTVSYDFFLRFAYQYVNYNGALYFVSDEGGRGSQLWKSDGTADGTVRVTDVGFAPRGAFPLNLTVFQGKLVFSGDGPLGPELWVSDGTAAGTRMVSNITQRPSSAYLASFTDVNGVLYFTADDGLHGVELWKADSHATELRVLAPPTAVAGQPFSVTVQAVNDFGDINPGYRGTVTFSGGDGATLPVDYTFTAEDAGSHAFTEPTLVRAGDQEIDVADVENAALQGAAVLTVRAEETVASFDVVFAGDVVVGQPVQMTVTARDHFGNIVTDYGGTVALYIYFARCDLPPDYDFTDEDQGSHTFTVTVFDPGELLVFVADNDAFAFGTAHVPVAPGG